ncbi:hypothetical protein MUP46_00230 [Patescibacteria group bacterium]|nr:hypothetical protein [Patescibacteria group bacterium]
MKKKWVLAAPAILYITACWFWIMSASAHSDCSQAGPVWQTHGLCLGRSLAEASCFAVYLAAWTWLGGKVAKGKGRHPAIGWLLGFTLEFIGWFLMMQWEPRRDRSGQMIGWDEYKHLTVEEREAIRPARVPLSPYMKRRRVIVIVIVIVFALLLVFTKA